MESEKILPASERTVLRKALNRLKEHEEVIKNEHLRLNHVLDIEKGLNSKENLTKVFRVSIRARPNYPLAQVKKGIREFERKYDKIVKEMDDLSRENAPKKHEWLLRELRKN